MSLPQSLNDSRDVELPDFPPIKMLKPKILSDVLGQAISGGVISSLYVLQLSRPSLVISSNESFFIQSLELSSLSFPSRILFIWFTECRSCSIVERKIDDTLFRAICSHFHSSRSVYTNMLYNVCMYTVCVFFHHSPLAYFAWIHKWVLTMMLTS